MTRHKFAISHLTSLSAKHDLGVSAAVPSHGRGRVARDATVADDPKDLVAKLIKDYKKEYDAVINNGFRKKMETATATDVATIKGFKWYMIQDFFYLLNLLLYNTDRANHAPNRKVYDALTQLITDGVGWAKGGLDACINNLNIPEDHVFNAQRDPALTEYVQFITDIATKDNWVMALVAIVPCIQSYAQIATELKNMPNIPTDTLWYKYWIADNSTDKYSKDQHQIFIDNAAVWQAADYNELAEIFKRGCQHEIKLWAITNNPGVVD